MKPVAIVDGKKVDVEGVSYYDNKPHSVMVKPDYRTLYFHKDNIELIWQDRYAPVGEMIQKRIDAYEERMNDLAIDFIESNRPFEVEVQKEYHRLKEHVEGLIEALGLIAEAAEPIQNEKMEVI